MNTSLKMIMGVLGIAVTVAACSPGVNQRKAQVDMRPGLPPEPVVTYSSTDAQPGQTIKHGEWIVDVDDARKRLHAQHHPHNVLETRRVPS